MKQNSCTGNKRKVSFANWLKAHYEVLLMILPGFLGLLLFVYYPMMGSVLAFKDYKLTEGIWGSSWVGFEYFIELFNGMDFWHVVKNTLVISILKLVCGFPMPIILALALNEVRNSKFKRVVQTCTYLPHFFSWVVLGGIMMMLFSVTGPINTILQFLGFKEPVVFFGENVPFLTMLITSTVWQGMGWSAIVYIAAISGIDESMYEAAYIDGAGKFKQIIYITLPSIIATITTVFIINLGHVLNAGFDQVYNLYTPAVYEVADIIDTYSLRKLRNMDYEIGTAIGLFKSVIGLLLVLTSNWIIKKLSDDELGVL